MVVNHAGTLTQDYFRSYIKLVMNANECSLKEAKNKTFKHLFETNESRFGNPMKWKLLLENCYLINSQIGHKLAMNGCMKKSMVLTFPH
jgi:hypothetical protein